MESYSTHVGLLILCGIQLNSKQETHVVTGARDASLAKYSNYVAALVIGVHEMHGRVGPN